MKPFEQATTEELRALWEAQHKTPEIVPAEPLKNVPDYGTEFWRYDKENHRIYRDDWESHQLDFTALIEQRLFPYTPEGKLGAELRAKRGLIPHPGIHWQEDLRKLKQARIEWGKSDFHDTHAEIPLVNAVVSFLDKYLTE